MIEPSEHICWELIRKLIREAGQCASAAAQRRADLARTTKAGPLDPVTETDLEIERLISTAIAALFPQDRFWGEETGRQHDPRVGRVWICDPIDGTRSFIRFGHDYCISLGLLVDGQIQYGIIYDPERDDLYEARSGEGAFLNATRLRLEPLPNLAHALVGIGYSERVNPDQHADALREIIRNGAMCHQHGSGALALAQIAAGRLDAYIELHQNAWDALPGLLIAEEAGALCLGWSRDNLISGTTTLAANPGIASSLALIAIGSKTPEWGVNSLSHSSHSKPATSPIGRVT